MLALVASVGEHVGFGGRMDRPGEGRLQTPKTVLKETKVRTLICMQQL